MIRCRPFRPGEDRWPVRAGRSRRRSRTTRRERGRSKRKRRRRSTSTRPGIKSRGAATKQAPATARRNSTPACHQTSDPSDPRTFPITLRDQVTDGRRFSIVCMQTDLLHPQIPTPPLNILSLPLLSECGRFAILGGGGGRSSPGRLAPSPLWTSTKNFPAPPKIFLLIRSSPGRVGGNVPDMPYLTVGPGAPKSAFRAGIRRAGLGGNGRTSGVRRSHRDHPVS
jgi:hypothetical protein